MNIPNRFVDVRLLNYASILVYLLVRLTKNFVLHSIKKQYNKTQHKAVRSCTHFVIEAVSELVDETEKRNAK